MKKLIIAALFAFVFINVKAQITLENTYLSEVRVANFSSMAQKFYYLDSDNIYLYNMDHTIWKKITVNKYLNYRFTAIHYLSDNLFNSDNQVEFIIQYESTIAYPGGKTEIVSETGTVIKSLDSVYGFFEVIFDESSKTSKLRTISTTIGTGDLITKIYSLPGNLPCVVCGGKELGIANPIKEGETYISEPVPNPASDLVSIYYRLPTTVFSGEILIFNTSGKLMNTYSVNRNTDNISINTSQLLSGTYYYHLKVNGAISSSRNLTIVK